MVVKAGRKAGSAFPHACMHAHASLLAFAPWFISEGGATGLNSIPPITNTGRNGVVAAVWWDRVVGILIPEVQVSAGNEYSAAWFC